MIRTEYPVGFAPIYQGYKCKSRKRGIAFSLTKREVFELVTQPCYYCGIVPNQVYRSQGSYQTLMYRFLYNGIDRVDNARGYITGNCVPCCGSCNRGKWIDTPTGYIDRCKRVAALHGDHDA